MDGRVRELAVKAGLYVDVNGQPWPRNMNGEDIEGAYQKFAQLIVRECMFQIKEEHNLNSNGTEPAGPYAHGFDDGMFVAIKTIQEHFGVEE